MSQLSSQSRKILAYYLQALQFLGFSLLSGASQLVVKASVWSHDVVTSLDTRTKISMSAELLDNMARVVCNCARAGTMEMP